MIFILLLALLLFGPKKLPELGRTIGKAMSQFRRAQSELKATFDREMQNLERETGIKELTQTNYHADSYNYDYSSYDTGEPGYYDGSYDSTATTTVTAGASAIEGAGSAPLQIEAAAGSIANGHLDAGHMEYAPVSSEPAANGHTEPGHSEASHVAREAATEKPGNS